MVKMVETVHDLRSASNDYNDMIFTAKSGSSFFFSLGNLLLCDRKHESDENPGQTQPKVFPRGEPWGRRPVSTHLLINPEAYMLLTECYMYLTA